MNPSDSIGYVGLEDQPEISPLSPKISPEISKVTKNAANEFLADNLIP